MSKRVNNKKHKPRRYIGSQDKTCVRSASRPINRNRNREYALEPFMTTDQFDILRKWRV